MSDEEVSVIPLGRDMADAASKAFVTFGRASGHPTKLNFGVCLAYAVSTVMRAPLLFKGPTSDTPTFSRIRRRFVCDRRAPVKRKSAVSACGAGERHG